MLDEKDLQAIASLIDTKLDTKLDPINSRLDKMDSRLDKMDSRLDKLDNDVLSIKCIIEDEIRKNIQFIAEAHGFSNEHSQKALSVAQETRSNQEIYGIRLKMVENDIERLKKAVRII